eukprot:2117166-Pyramimonas_sp.AAC.1
MEPAGAQHVGVARTCAPIVAISGCAKIAFRWASTIAHTFSSKLCRIRLDLLRLNLSKSSCCLLYTSDAADDTPC